MYKIKTLVYNGISGTTKQIMEYLDDMERAREDYIHFKIVDPIERSDLLYETYYYKKTIHRIDNAAYIRYHYDKITKERSIHTESFLTISKKHRIDGPAFINYRDNEVEWWINGKPVNNVPFTIWPLNEEEQIELKLLVL